MTQTIPTAHLIQRLPKVELHLHMEGAIPLPALFSIMQKNRPDIPIASVEELSERFAYRDFGHFLETWTWKNTFFTEVDDFEFAAYETLKDLASQNVKYVEAFYSPGDFWRQQLPVEGITEAICHGVLRARSDFGIHCQMIADVIRDHGPETAMRRLDELKPYLGGGVIGIGLGGSEHHFPAELFTDVYRRAEKMGYRLTAHAGEVAGAESIRSAIENLGAERIGHGLRAYEDPRLLDLLQKRRIPLEMCIISNLRTAAWSSPEPHPFGDFFRRGLLVTVNSDDPTLFNASLTDEYAYLADQLNFSVEDLESASLLGIEASFLSDADKQELRRVFEDEWQILKSH